MKAGKKIQKMRERRTKQHQDGLAERRRKGYTTDLGYKFPGSNNRHKQ